MTGPASTPPQVGHLSRAAGYLVSLEPAGEEWRSSRFGRLALVNMLSAAGDALVVVALAGSVFVTVPLNAARGRTALGLLCTLLPFALVAPLIGPAADRTRKGKRLVVFLASLGRLAAALMMMAWLHSLLLFPAAFLSLVCSKTHVVARSALVPGMGGDRRLVRANSRLAVGSGVAGALAAGVGAALYAVLGSRSVLQLDALVFAMTATLALMLPPPAEVGWPTAGDPAVSAAPPGAGLRPATVVMTGVRGMAGFLTALVAFGFREQGAAVAWFGLAAAAGAAGSLAGAALAPATRRAVHSDGWQVALAALLIAATAGLAGGFGSGQHRLEAVALAASVGVGSALGKTAFDALVQAGVEETRRAGAFARLEALLQVSWVVMALVPTLIFVPMAVGFVVIAAVLAAMGLGLVVRLARS